MLYHAFSLDYFKGSARHENGRLASTVVEDNSLLHIYILEKYIIYYFLSSWFNVSGQKICEYIVESAFDLHEKSCEVMQ